MKSLKVMALDFLRAAAGTGKWIEGVGEEQQSIAVSAQLASISTKIAGYFAAGITQAISSFFAGAQALWIPPTPPKPAIGFPDGAADQVCTLAWVERKHDCNKENLDQFKKSGLPPPVRMVCYGTARAQLPNPSCDPYHSDLRKFVGTQVKGSLSSGANEIKNMVETTMKFIQMMMKAQKLKMEGQMVMGQSPVSPPPINAVPGAKIALAMVKVQAAQFIYRGYLAEACIAKKAWDDMKKVTNDLLVLGPFESKYNQKSAAATNANTELAKRLDEQEQLTSGLSFPEGPEKVAKTSFKPLEEDYTVLYNPVRMRCSASMAPSLMPGDCMALLGMEMAQKKMYNLERDAEADASYGRSEYSKYQMMAIDLAEEVDLPDISWPPPKVESPKAAIKKMMAKAGVKSMRNEQ